MLEAWRITLVVTTYNRPDGLEAVLCALNEQTLQGFDVIVADDGSTPDTRALIHTYAEKASYPLRHIWQADNGFQAAAIRNRALEQTQRDYVIFLDGDCIPLTDFVQSHCRLAEHGYFVAGNRVLTSAAFSQNILLKQTPVWRWSWRQGLWAYLTGGFNRWTPFVRLYGDRMRKNKPMRWQGVKTCNLAAWKKDVLAVNGFDEAYQGWGYEDSDLVIRLIQNGVSHKSGRFAIPVIHLWHLEADRKQEPENLRRLQCVLEKNRY